MRDVDNGGCSAQVRVPSPQFCREPKTDPKNKVLKKNEGPCSPEFELEV